MVDSQGSCMVCLCMLAISMSAMGLDFIGTPVSELEKGQWALSGTYSDSEVDFEIDEGDYEPFSLKFRDVDSRKLYPSFHYGWTENIDLIFSVGVTETDMEGYVREDSDSDDCYLGFGLKTTLWHRDRWGLGFTGKVNWSRSYFDGLHVRSEFPPPYSEAAVLDLWEFMIAGGISYAWSDQLNFYGGPFAHFLDGRMKFDDLEGHYPLMYVLVDGTYGVDEVSVWGGYIGAQYELSDNLLLSAEYQTTQSNDGAAIRLMWRF